MRLIKANIACTIGVENSTGISLIIPLHFFQGGRLAPVPDLLKLFQLALSGLLFSSLPSPAWIQSHTCPSISLSFCFTHLHRFVLSSPHLPQQYSHSIAPHGAGSVGASQWMQRGSGGSVSAKMAIRMIAMVINKINMIMFLPHTFLLM
jgi:hypothetical protein